MKILIAVDGSAYTQKALNYLLANRAMFVDGHELVVVNVCTGISGHVARHLSKEIVADYYAEENAKVLDPVKAWFAEKAWPTSPPTRATATRPRKSSSRPPNRRPS